MFCTKLTLVVIFLGCSSHFDIARGSFGYVKSDRGSMVCFRERIASESLVGFRLNSCDAYFGGCLFRGRNVVSRVYAWLLRCYCTYRI